MKAWIRDVFRGRPGWMNALMVFCAYMAFVYVPWDLFVKPVAQDQEVWFGILFTGWMAKVLAIPHGFVYAAGYYGFRRRRPWMALWAPIYTLQIAFSGLVWSILYFGGFTGWLLGVVFASPFVLLAYALFHARGHFRATRPTLSQRYGEWALVTGASAGIGEAFARALAREGVSTVLTARREEKLTTLASELSAQYGTSTRVVPADLSKAGDVERLLEAIADLDIAILINNAGLGCAGRFDRREAEDLVGLVAVNCAAPVALTAGLLPTMRDRRRGAVVILGSVAGRQPLGLHAVYAATKAFDLFFGEALYVEMKEHGVDVLVVEPGTTETEFQEISGETAHPGVSAETVVEVALSALGHQPSVVVGWFEWLRANAAGRIAPRPLTAYLARDVMAGRVSEDLR